MNFEDWKPSDVIGWIIGIIGAIVAVVYALRADKNKELVYEVTEPLALASVLPNTEDRRISIIYERAGETPLPVSGVYLRYVRIGNSGREAIRKQDIAETDTLQLKITGGRVLDVEIAGVTREVNNLHIIPIYTKENGAAVTVGFNFLDYRDGALLRVLSATKNLNVKMDGTVIGMSGGIKRGRRRRARVVIYTVGVSYLLLLFGMLYLLNVWVYALSVPQHGHTSLLLQLLIVVLIATFVLSPFLLQRLNPQFWPKSILLPDWFTEKQYRVWDERHHDGD